MASTEQNELLIKLQGLHKAFGKMHVLNGMDLDVHRREVVVILGGSGTGKSVTLKHIVGLLEPDRGSIELFGQNTADLNRQERFNIRRRFGMLFQSGALLNSLSVYNNVALPLREHERQMKEPEIKERVMRCLSWVDMDHAAQKFPSEISGGMKKRAALARAVVHDPEVILYDEPTSGLDPVMSNVINDLILNIRDRVGAGSIVVTHDISSAYRIADRIVMVYKGKVLANGSSQDIQSSDHPVVKQFLAGDTKGPITEEKA